MDFDLQRMLVKTINIKHVTDESSGGDESLTAAIPMLAHVENVLAVGQEQGGTESTMNHLVITKDPIIQDDRIWLPGDDPSDVNLGKHPLGPVRIFYDPFDGSVDHYEVTL